MPSHTHNEFWSNNIFDNIEGSKDGTQYTDCNPKGNIRSPSSLYGAPERLKTMPRICPPCCCLSREEMRSINRKVSSRKKSCYHYANQKWCSNSIEDQKVFVSTLSDKVTDFITIFKGNPFYDKKEKQYKPYIVRSSKRSRIKEGKYCKK